MFRIPNDLLIYNPTYRILICRECQYAIQKSAVSSHFLRHKIYREERQRLLAYSTGLDLPEPDHVDTPGPGTPAIDGLPLIAGYVCTSDACGKLYASLKRMKKHWSEMHGDGSGSELLFMRPVVMQTFFRGTKIRYFEVSTDLADGSCGDAPPDACSEDDDILMATPDNVWNKCGNSNASVQTLDSGQMLISLQRSSTQLARPHQSLDVPSIDLDILRYFHHYTTAASSGLPVAQEEPRFWEMTVVEQALKHEWLMCGLLAISACHLAMSATDRDDSLQHSEQLPRFLSSFSANSNRVENSMSTSTSVPKHLVLSKTYDCIDCILRCAQWSLASIAARNNDTFSQPDTFSIPSLVTTLRRLAQLCITSTLLDSEATFALAKASLGNKINGPNPAYHDLRNRLRVLPNELSNTLGRPSQVQDVLTILSATAALVVQCDVAFTKDAVNTVWGGMVGWLTALSEYFDHMLKHNDPAALVLLAYWAVLVERAHDCGLWWLDGIAEKVVREAHRLLELENSDLRRLVQDLVV
jgi:hypothetical protein